LAEESILTDDFLRELMNVGEVDILVGVPTYNDARTVGQVVQAVRAGLLKYFPRQRAVIVNADGGSRDTSRDLVRAASISDLQHASNLHALRTLHCVSTRYPGDPSTGRALHTFVAAAELLRASAVAVVAPDSTTFEPDWIERLLRPVTRQNFDLVTPIYCRHKFDGLLVRNLAYPLVRALYGKRLREPLPSEFAFSGGLAAHILNQDFWEQEPGHVGTELALVISALSGNFKVSQSFLGAKNRSDHAPADLVFALRQTAGVLFWSLESNEPAWRAPEASQPIPTDGPECQVTLDPLRINRKRLYQMFSHGVAELEPVLRTLLSPGTMAELQRIAALPEEQFCYPDELWVRTVYEFAGSYHRQVISRDHIVQALAPLYRGRAYCFLLENRDTSAEQVEANVEGLSQTFERLKPCLLDWWQERK
jgi:hypothetical protein